jgi:hypothetical protein
MIMGNKWIVGFTGTRNGMTQKQRDAVSDLLYPFPTSAIGLHEDCVGADEVFNDICLLNGLKTQKLNIQRIGIW